MRTITSLTLIVSLIFLFPGCGGDGGRPADMPPLFPVTITITQEGVPLEGATVTLHSSTPSTYGTATGTTDSSGTARMRTYGFNGAPAGEYVVTVDRVALEGAEEFVQNPGENPQLRGGTLYRFVNENFTKRGTTTLNMTVADNRRGTTETFDVGAAVRIANPDRL